MDLQGVGEAAPAEDEDEQPAPAEGDDDEEEEKDKKKCLAVLAFWEKHKDNKEVKTSVMVA